MDSARLANRFLVIEAIRTGGGVSRGELVELTGLSAGSVSAITRELVDHGIIAESRIPVEGRGRPRVDLRLNASAANLAGVVVFWNGRVEVQITDLSGTLIHAHAETTPPGKQGEELADIISSALHAAMRGAGSEVAQPYAVGVCLFGTVDTKRGIVHWLPPGVPSPVPLQAMIEERTGIPAFIDNEANIIARTEYWLGQSDSAGKRHLLTIGAGIGMATSLDGVIQNGGRGVNLEFGHIKSPYGMELPCMCGGKGCLVMTASASGIVTRSGIDAPPYSRKDSDLARSFEQLAQKARAGDGPTLRLFEEAGLALGLSLANMINVSNPVGVTVLVEYPAWLEFAGPAFRAAVEQNQLGFLRDDMAIDLKADHTPNYPLGAVAMVQERLFQQTDLPDWSRVTSQP